MCGHLFSIVNRIVNLSRKNCSKVITLLPYYEILFTVVFTFFTKTGLSFKLELQATNVFI